MLKEEEKNLVSSKETISFEGIAENHQNLVDGKAPKNK